MNEILINYKIDNKIITIFGEYFVNENIKKCFIVCEDKVYKLQHKFDTDLLKKRMEY